MTTATPSSYIYTSFLSKFLRGMSRGVCLGACILITLSSIGYAQEDSASFVADYISEERSGLADTLETAIQNTPPSSKREALDQFCSLVYAHDTLSLTLPSGRPMTYDAKQSIFLYMLCSYIQGNVGNKREDMQAQEGMLLPDGDSLTDLQLICEARTGDDIEEIYQPSGCIPGCETASMNECDVGLLTSRILQELFNDASNVGTSMSYGLIQPREGSKTDLSDIANTTAIRYFGVPLCDKESLCYYPRTHAQVVRTLQKADRISKQTRIIATSALKDYGTDESHCPNPESGKQTRKCLYAGNILIMGKLWDSIYNEFMFHQLLMSYYSSLLVENSPFTDFSVGVDQRRLIANSNNQELLSIQNHNSLHSTALASMQRMLLQRSASFPMHVGLLAYRESAHTLRRAMSKLYLPLHQLHYKLQNVQQAGAG